jgi:hypothetical protein
VPALPLEPVPNDLRVLDLSVVEDVTLLCHTTPTVTYRCETSVNGQSKPLLAATLVSLECSDRMKHPPVHDALHCRQCF